MHASKFALEFRKLFPFSKLFDNSKIVFLKQMFPNFKNNSKMFQISTMRFQKMYGLFLKKPFFLKPD